MPIHFPHVALDAFVIMPSHVHGIIVIADTGGEGDASGRPYRRRRGTTSAGVGQAVAGPRDYIIDRIGQFVDAGVDEIMSPPFRDAETAQRVDEEIVAAFDRP